MTTLARTRTPDPRTRLGRRRTSASAGGLAVLLGSTAPGRRPAVTTPGSAPGAPEAPAGLTGSAGSAGLTGPTAHLGVVARAGGGR